MTRSSGLHAERRRVVDEGANGFSIARIEGGLTIASAGSAVAKLPSLLGEFYKNRTSILIISYPAFAGCPLASRPALRKGYGAYGPIDYQFDD